MFLFIILSTSFLSHIKYKLNQKKHKRILNFSFIKMTPFGCYHCFTRLSAFFLPKTGGRIKIVLHNFLQELTEVSCTCDFLVKFIPHQFSGFMSADCAGQDISWRTDCSSLLFMYFWHEYKFLIHKPRSWWDSVMLQVFCDSNSDSICPLLGANPWLCNWQMPVHTITEPPPELVVIQGVANHSSTLRCT